MLTAFELKTDDQKEKYFNEFQMPTYNYKYESFSLSGNNGTN